MIEKLDIEYNAEKRRDKLDELQRS
jgi:hypothetical protein